MDAVEFLKTKNRICRSSDNCWSCILGGKGGCQIGCAINQAINEEELVAKVEKWAVEYSSRDKTTIENDSIKAIVEGDGEATLILQRVDEALVEVQEYRKLGSPESLKETLESMTKFYYCESEDDYYIGRQVGNFYYAKYSPTGFVWFMSRYLPWGKCIVNPDTLWKKHTYPSEPKEIPFESWLEGFIKKYNKPLHILEED